MKQFLRDVSAVAILFVISFGWSGEVPIGFICALAGMATLVLFQELESFAARVVLTLVIGTAPVSFPVMFAHLLRLPYLVGSFLAPVLPLTSLTLFEIAYSFMGGVGLTWAWASDQRHVWTPRVRGSKLSDFARYLFGPIAAVFGRMSSLRQWLFYGFFFALMPSLTELIVFFNIGPSAVIDFAEAEAEALHLHVWGYIVWLCLAIPLGQLVGLTLGASVGRVTSPGFSLFRTVAPVLDRMRPVFGNIAIAYSVTVIVFAGAFSSYYQLQMPNAAFVSAGGASLTFSDFLFFSVTTITTIGMSDVKWPPDSPDTISHLS